MRRGGAAKENTGSAFLRLQREGKAEDRQKKRIKVAEALANRSSRDERAGETGGSKKGKLRYGCA